MGFLTALMYIVLSLATGVSLIAISLELISIDVVSAYLTNILSDGSLKLSLFLVGLLLIFLCLRYLRTIFSSSRKNKSIVFESPEGRVSITLFAIEDMLKKMLEAKTEVSHIQPKVYLRKKFIEVNTRGILTTEVNLVEFTKDIQEKVREKMKTLLGEEREVRVNLEIRKVSLGGKKALSEELEPEIPFRNYE